MISTSTGDVWTPAPAMNKHRSAAGVAAFDGHVYGLGGHDGLSIFDSVERFDPTTGVWLHAAAMLSKRCRSVDVFLLLLCRSRCRPFQVLQGSKMATLFQ